MAGTIKAGIEHIIKVNTKADKMGLETGFNLKYFNDNTKVMTAVTAPFFEFIENITPTSTTVVGAYSIGATIITVLSAAGFTAGSSVKIGGNFYRLVAVDGVANTVTLKQGLTTAVADTDPLDLSGRTGTYGVPVTFPNAGDYTVHITNYSVGMDNEAAPIHVASASVDDVKALLDVVNTDITSVKTQVDLLDEATLNGVSGQVTQLSTDLSAVHTLLKDSSDVYIEIAGNETAIIGQGETLTGTTSTATGIVQYVTYDATAGVTKVTLQSTTGTFVTGETVSDGTATTTGTITTTQNNVINSVIEFVKDIETLLKSGSGLEALKTINADIEAMVKGDALLSDGVTVNPTANKGLAQIFDELVLAHTDIADIKTIAHDATNGFVAIKTSIVDARASIEGKIAALIDETDPLSLASKVNAIKTVVDSNAGLLTDATNGLAPIKAAIDNVSALFATGGTAILRFDSVDTALSNLDTAITAQTAHLDAKFNDVMTKLTTMNETTKYAVFA